MTDTNKIDYDLTLTVSQKGKFKIEGNEAYNQLLKETKRVNDLLNKHIKKKVKLTKQELDEFENVKQKVIGFKMQVMNLANYVFGSSVYSFIEANQNSTKNAVSQENAFEMIQDIYQQSLETVCKYVEEDSDVLFTAKNKKDLLDEHNSNIDYAVDCIINHDAYFTYFGDLPLDIQSKLVKNDPYYDDDNYKYMFLVLKDKEMKIIKILDYPMKDVETINKKVDEIRKNNKKQ